jgi:hypothetical protein
VGLDYYEEYCINTFESLQSRLDSKGYLQQDVRLRGDFPSLGGLKKIYGHLNVDNDILNDLGELIYVKTDLWLNSEKSNLNSLCKLKEVGGNLSLRYSNIEELRELQKVGGNVNLRDTPIKRLGKLKYVGGNLFLPKRLEGINLDEIEIKGKVRYWNDKKDSKVGLLNKEHNSESELFFSDIHNQELKKEKRVLNGKFLLNRCFSVSEYNNFIIDNFNEFISFVDLEIEKLYGEKYSFYHSLYGEIKSTKEINKEFPKLKVDKRKSDYSNQLRKLSNSIILKEKKKYPFNKYIEILNNFKKDEDWNKGSSTYWLRYDEHKLGFGSYSGDKEGSFIYFVENKLLETFSVFVDILQNRFRVSKGIPKIGEGWVSETELYYKIKEYFSEVEVKQHGRSKWLGKQHIDIWIPKYRIGIEYQGEQHQKPIDFFGGEEGFIKNKERDERKKRLFKENNSSLVEVLPNYNFDEVIKEIESYIKSLTN